MKNLLFTVALTLVGLLSLAQVTINTQLPPIGLTLKSQLWNLSLINSSGIGITVQIQLTVTDVSTNQTVFTAQTRPFFISPSAMQVSGRDLQPITYSANNPAYSVDNNPNGFLPIGLFNFCYSLVRMDAHAQRTADESCDQVQVAPLSPPMLVNPADSEEVDNSRPMFIWIPPVPSSLFSNLSYDYHLVEVQPTQSAAEAVQQNIPVLFQSNIRSTNLQYPLSAPPLDSFKLYAWQIVAKNNSAPVGTSEAWAFRLKKDIDAEKPTKQYSSFYSKLSRENGNALTVCNGVLHFTYLQEVNSNSIQIAITDITNSKQQVVQLDSNSFPVHFGDNLMNLDLRALASIRNKHFYLMDLTNASGEHWYLKFQYLKKD